MARLRTLKPKLAALQTQAAKPAPSRRMTGRKLQDRRLNMWLANPHCAMCGRHTAFPGGFELDHKVALSEGGEDTEANCQVLCVYLDPFGNKSGCHHDKTVGR